MPVRSRTSYASAATLSQYAATANSGLPNPDAGIFGVGAPGGQIPDWVVVIAQTLGCPSVPEQWKPLLGCPPTQASPPPPTDMGDTLTGSGPCPEGTVRIPGTNRCAVPGDLFPGGAPGIIPETGNGTGNGVGMFGRPVTPRYEAVPTLKCPKNHVLGEDNMCYHKKVLPAKFRKWKPGPKPPVTVAQNKALSQASSARNAAERLAKKAGLYVAKKRPQTRPRSPRKC